MRHCSKWIGFLLACNAIAFADLPTASEVLNAAGIQGGFCVVVGTVDGELEAGLTDGGRVLVHGLALDEAKTLAARKNLFTKEMYPLASVSYVPTAATLPFLDRLVNVLVADLDALGDKGPPMSEINRVLGYNATAYIKQGGSWKKHYVPIPSDVNEFSHWKDDSTLSSYQNDHRIRIPNQVRWIGAPDAYFTNEERRGLCLFESERVAGCTWTGTVGGGTWARDAFSGVLLWREDYLGINFPSVAHQSTNQMWAMNSKYLFGYTGRIGEGLVAYNLRSGEIEKKYFNTALLRSQLDKRGNTIENQWDKKLFGVAHTLIHGSNLVQSFGRKVWYLNQESGEIIWSWEAEGDSATIIRNCLIQDTVLAVAVTQFVDTAEGNAMFGPAREYFANFKQAVGLRISDGKLLWTLDGLPNGQKRFHEMIAGGHGKCVLVYTNREPRHCLNVHTGDIEWSINDAAGYGVGSYRGNIISMPNRETLVFAAHDSYSTHTLADGAVIGKMSLKDYFGACPATTVTPDNVIVCDKWVPVSYLDTKNKDDYYRMVTIGASACSYIPIIAYGSMYQIGGKCSCRRTIPTQSCSEAVDPVTPIPDTQRLVTSGVSGATIGGAIENQTVAKGSRIGDEWTERCLGVYMPRSANVCAAPVASGKDGVGQFMVSGEQLKHWHRMPAWTGIARQETAPAQVGDISVVSVVHEQRICAKRGGEEIWNFIPDSRVTGDPVADQTCVYFGGHDGYVYAVNANDGSLAWKFMAAPDDRRMVAYGQVESCWPVFGVALHDGKLYAVAGRLATLDGGLHAYCLNTTDGEVQWHTTNRSGYVDESVEHNGADNIKNCTDGAEMSDIRGWIIDNAINDQPYLEGNLLKIPDWHIDITNPTDVIMFPENLPTTRTIQRTNGAVKERMQISPLIKINNGALWVIGAANESYRVGINNAMGRCIASFTKTGTQKIDIGLNDLPNGVYILWVQMKGTREFTKLKLTSVR